MPANLNALIRYKTIDRCLSNRHRQWSIHGLMGKCSEALEEFRGISTGISERTIRDDIRVMRSDILGFNAPIEFRNGHYYYSDPFYTIFNIKVTDARLMERILTFLVEIRMEITHPELEKMIESLSKLVRVAASGPLTERPGEAAEDVGISGADLDLPAPLAKKKSPLQKRKPFLLSLKSGRKDIYPSKEAVRKLEAPATRQFEWRRVLDWI